MNRRRNNGRTRRSARTGSIEVFIRPEETLVGRVLRFIWHVRVEIVAVVVAVFAWHRITQVMEPWAALALIAVLVAVVFAVPYSRRYVVAHVWCTVTRHRLRACLVQVRAMNHDGAIPWFFWVRPTPVGERVLLLMRPGVCVTDIETSTEHIAAACWATEARVRRSRRFAALVTVDVVRRNPLAPKHTIGSPLTRIPDQGQAPADEAMPPARKAPAVSVKPAGLPAASIKPPAERPAATTRPTPDRPATTVSTTGEDVSDYV